MGFSVPTFNLTCDIFTGPTAGGGLRLSSPCNLALGRRASAASDGSQVNNGQSVPMSLLLPAHTDIRDDFEAPGHDFVEVPQGSGRFYEVWQVDDIGKGFPNEHRFALLYKALWVGGQLWPHPIP